MSKQTQDDRELRMAEAADPSTPIDRLDALAKDDDLDVQWAVAENPSVSHRLLPSEREAIFEAAKSAISDGRSRSSFAEYYGYEDWMARYTDDPTNENGEPLTEDEQRQVDEVIASVWDDAEKQMAEDGTTKWGVLKEAIEGRWTSDHGTIPDKQGRPVRETLGMWIWRCMNANTSDCPDQRAIMRELCDESDDLDEFLERVHGDGRLRTTSQAWGELAKAMGWGPLGAISESAQVYFTSSDAGGVLVGDLSGTFGIVVNNGYGDGKTMVVVADRGQVNGDRFRFETTIEGQAKVYRYDCADLSDDPGDAVTILDGRHGVYYGDGCVVFERWDER